MADRDIEELYKEHIEEASKGAKRAPKGSGAERRKSPRLITDSTELSVRAELKVNAIDISVSGLAFYSRFPVQIGQYLNITLSNMFTVDAEVVSCRLESHDEEYTDLKYKVQCQFPEEEQGKYLLVAIKELEKRKRASQQND